MRHGAARGVRGEVRSGTGASEKARGGGERVGTRAGVQACRRVSPAPTTSGGPETRQGEARRGAAEDLRVETKQLRSGLVLEVPGLVPPDGDARVVVQRIEQSAVCGAEVCGLKEGDLSV